ncbi:hypothetical protein [Pseudobutyrivibrio ruminis]|uniref:hypothetical protein n=1 Tax=Pseudobutyrivibrio ruminis TaxID=46206 RepID=UPI0004177BD3|nr:hypothetical protein [Pseudobutyrivibrio ruminis]
MKTKWLCIVAAAVLVVSASAVKPALAYFTATKTIEGTTKELKIGDSIPDIHEDIDGMIKKITIMNTGEYDIFVRAKAITPDNWEAEFTPTDGWKEKDGYYYYDKPLAPDEQTATALTLEIKPKNVSETYEVPEKFNVIIVQEATKVVFDKDGNPVPDDWANAITSQINAGE